MSPKPKRRAKVITTDGPVSLPRRNPAPANREQPPEEIDISAPAEPGARANDVGPGPESLGVDRGEAEAAEMAADAAEAFEAADEPVDDAVDDDPFDSAAAELDEAEDTDDIDDTDVDDDEVAAAAEAELPPAEAQQVEPAQPVPDDVLRLQSDLVQGAVRREQRIAEITAAVAQAISKAHREVNQSASELDSLRSMLQGVASADESQSFLEIERVQETIEATQAEWAGLSESRYELETELANARIAMQDHATALDKAEADRVSIETERNEAERRAQELFDRLAEATTTNAELKSRLDDVVAAEDVTAKLETRIRSLTAEKATAVHQAKTNEAALQQRLDQALEKLAAAQQARADDQAAASDTAIAEALDKAQADAIKMKAELDMARAELANTKGELDQAYVAETELETKLQSAWATADEATAEQQTAASDQQRLLRDLSDANQNLERMRARLDKAAGERQDALDKARSEHQDALDKARSEHQDALDEAAAEHEKALKAAAAETQAAIDKQSRDHQAGVAALKAAHKKKLNRYGEDLQEQATKTIEKLQAEKSELQDEVAAFAKLKQQHADELAQREADADKLRKAHARELDSRAAATERLERTHSTELDEQKAATEQVEARLKKLQTAHNELLEQQKKFEADRKAIDARSKENADLTARLEANDARAVEREAELEKLRLSSDDTHQRIGTLLGQIETLQASADAQTAHVDEIAKREAELEAEVAQLRKQATSAIEARSKVIKGAESTALLASQAETRAEQLDRDLQQAVIERDAVTGALTTAEARIVNLEAELDRITTLADQRVQAAFESATALGERAIADAEAKEQRIQELEAQLSMLQRRGTGVS